MVYDLSEPGPVPDLLHVKDIKVCQSRREKDYGSASIKLVLWLDVGPRCIIILLDVLTSKNLKK